MNKTLPEDILGAKFGTKNRAELILRTDSIKNAVKGILWMARRYANGRQTYAPDMFNDAYDVLVTQLGQEIDNNKARDMENNEYLDISIPHTKDHPYAMYDHDKPESQTNLELKRRKFYKK